MAVPAPAIMPSFQQAGKGAGTGHPASSEGMTWRFRDNSRSSPFGATKSTSILKHKEAGTSRLRSGQFCDKGEKWLLRIREHSGPEWSSDEVQTEQGPLRGAWRREAALGIAPQPPCLLRVCSGPGTLEGMGFQGADATSVTPQKPHNEEAGVLESEPRKASSWASQGAALSVSFSLWPEIRPRRGVVSSNDRCVAAGTRYRSGFKQHQPPL